MMNTALPEIIHRLDTSLENTSRNGGGRVRMSALEHQQSRMLWQEEEQLQQPPPQVQQAEPGYFDSCGQMNLFSTPAQAQHFHGLIINDQNLGGLLTPRMESDPVAQSSACCNNFGSTRGDSFAFGACELGNVTGFGIFNAVSRSASCPPGVAAAFAEAASAATKRNQTLLPEKLSSSAGRESFKKRKADKLHNQGVAEEQSKNKMKRCMEEEESKTTEQKSKNIATTNKNTIEPSETSKENSKISEVQKPDYIHVRARRGQATDSHSLAERVRREKISERMKYLQDLVPGCNKITGKAGMLDEIINYVQSLQRQVEFLSMKLAAVNPRLDLDMDNIFSKEIFPVAASEPHVIEESSDMNNPANYQFAPIEQVISCCGLETDKNPPDMDMALRRTLSAPVSMPETLIEPPHFSQIYPYPTWDAELQSVYSSEFQQGKSTVLLSQPCTGLYGGSNIKIEM